MSNQCRWLHDWGTWKFVEQNEAMDGDKHIGTVTRQFRVCNRCRYTQTELKLVLV